ncbi:DNA translocase [Candidatus Photodesmus katoptron]|uniref:DNA translocase FtsK n=1 Tax=Candidatus Photodesmus katoptron Akat1 TaxID=1236703 RepID=S3DHH0_9GAMM|nr:DNA translocase FtsK [Candidatus Photodesmus katoptron Akat1]KEY90409.1 DNA translocase [Candidatus Photodesmus katoptron]
MLKNLFQKKKDATIRKLTKESKYSRLNSFQRLKECALILTVLSSILLSISLFTFSPSDPSWSQTNWGVDIQNADGILGAWIADTLFFIFGSLAYLIPILLLIIAWLFLKKRIHDKNYPIDLMLWGARLLGCVILILTSCGLADINFDDIWYFSSGGIIGDITTNIILPRLGLLGTILVFLFFWGAGFTLLTGISWLSIVECLGKQTIDVFCFIRNFLKKKRNTTALLPEQFKNQQKSTTTNSENLKQNSLYTDNSISNNKESVSFDNKSYLDSQTKAHNNSHEESKFNEPTNLEIILPETNLNEKKNQNYKKHISKLKCGLTKIEKKSMPSLDLLYHPKKHKNCINHNILENIARLIEAKLLDYKIKTKVVEIFPGPVITRFELDLAPGIKVSQISTLSMDLARSLSTTTVRIVEVIPGKPYVGIELPNVNRKTVYFSEVINSQAFIKAKSPTSIVLGQDIGGNAIVSNLSKMPHVLVAGTTGSGKSVGVNVMILSMLYKATPEEVRFIMIDPKMLELSVYEGIPHLLSEVVTDMKDASNALRWCIAEMDRRYKIMSTLGVRDITTFNKKINIAIKANQPIKKPSWYHDDTINTGSPYLEKIPYIVVIVDELADLILVVGKKVEELIIRLSQKARAAGIHLILATQRPSVDVITGLIKANIPTRIAFTVSTKTDSRTILDQGGAESLLGMGDMLYLPHGSNHAIRIHGTFAPDDDVHSVVKHWKKLGKPSYIDKIT